jgi:hypothetical protein
VQCRVRGGAQARHVAGVRRDFGFDEDDVHLIVAVSRTIRRQA